MMSGKQLLAAALFLALQAPSTQQIRDSLEAIARQLQQLIEQMPQAQPPIASASELQQALDAGGTVTLSAGGSFAGSFAIRRSGTQLVGNGATLTSGGEALSIAPDVDDVRVSNLSLASSGGGAVLRCGENGPGQTTHARQPQRIVLEEISIATHRGKRGIEFNCGGEILDSTILDVWASTLADSQAVWIGNTCGPVTVRGGLLVAASENILIGGDTLKITDCPDGVVSQVLIERLELSKPAAWRTDGVRRGAKNLLEMKAGKGVTVRDVKLRHSFGPPLGAQDGSAIVITPKNGQFIGDVTLEGLDVDEVAGGLQLMGRDYNSVTPTATTNVTVRRSLFRVAKIYGGRGILALVVGGMQAATFDGVTVTLDGNAMVVCDTQVPVGPLTFVDSRMTTGPYGVMAPGVNFGGPAPTGYEQRACVTSFTGNTLADAPSRFRTNHPENTWVTRAELDAIIAR